MAAKKDKPLKFEDAIEQLETLIEQIESGEAGLEKSIESYEQGMKLVSRCKEILSTAEKKIAELTTDDKGNLRDTDESA